MTNRSYIYIMRRKVEREELLEKGLELMLIKGYEGTGVQEIAEATGILKGSFYNYFTSKEEFTKALIGYYCEKGNELTGKILGDKSKKPLARIKKLFETYWSVMTAKHGYKAGCFLGNCSLEVGNTSVLLSNAVNDGMNDSIDLLVSCLKEAQEEGEISKDENCKALAEFLYIAWQGVLVRSKSANNNQAYKGFMRMIFNKILK